MALLRKKKQWLFCENNTYAKNLRGIIIIRLEDVLLFLQSIKYEHYEKKFVGARRLHHIYFWKASLFWAPRSIWHVSELCIFHVFNIVYIISFFQGTNILSFDFRSFVISITYFHDGMGTVERLFFAGGYFSWISCFFLNLRKIAKTQL